MRIATHGTNRTGSTCHTIVPCPSSTDSNGNQKEPSNVPLIDYWNQVQMTVAATCSTPSEVRCKVQSMFTIRRCSKSVMDQRSGSTRSDALLDALFPTTPLVCSHTVVDSTYAQSSITPVKWFSNDGRRSTAVRTSAVDADNRSSRLLSRVAFECESSDVESPVMLTRKIRVAAPAI
jgi:hypothetical protein